MAGRPVLALVVVAVLVLAGCSGTFGDGGGSITTDAPTPTDGPTTDGTTDRAANGTTAAPPEAGSNTTAAPTNGTLAVHYIDVGQGASALVVGPTGETILIDSGTWQDDGEAVIETLDRANVTRIDHLVTSHADADHIGGHAAVIDHLEENGDGVGAVYDPGVAAASQTYDEYLDAVERYEVPLYRTMAGDSIPLAGATVDVLAPPSGLLDGDRNENSLVLRVAFGRTAFLFTGDTAEAGESYLVETYGSGLRATVLHAGHHGSNTSSSDAVLDAVRPRLVIVSSAYDSPYDHPHEEVLARFAASDLPTAWTGVHGTVVVESDGESVTAMAQREATTDPTRLRDAGPFDGPGSGFVPLATLDGNGSDPATPEPDAETPDAGPLRVETVHEDAAGDDAENLDDEYLVFATEGDDPLDLSGWTVRDAAGHAYTFPDGTTIDPGGTLTLRTGSGTDSSTERHWGASSPVWNNDGDTVIVTRADGSTVLEVSYGGG